MYDFKKLDDESKLNDLIALNACYSSSNTLQRRRFRTGSSRQPNLEYKIRFFRTLNDESMMRKITGGYQEVYRTSQIGPFPDFPFVTPALYRVNFITSSFPSLSPCIHTYFKSLGSITKIIIIINIREADYNDLCRYMI